MDIKWRKALEIISRGLKEVIFPRDNKCLICKKEEVEGICNKCRNKITYSYDSDDEISIGYYCGPLKELILQLKCKGNFEAGDVLVNLIKDKVREYKDDYYITYIPISQESLKSRGFNQCEYIAKELGFICDIEVINTLKRIKDTKVQKTLSREERLENLKGAFAATDKRLIEGKNLILLDDVITTGATLNEAKRILKECNVRKIKILTLAKSHI